MSTAALISCCVTRSKAHRKKHVDVYRAGSGSRSRRSSVQAGADVHARNQQDLKISQDKYGTASVVQGAKGPAGSDRKQVTTPLLVPRNAEKGRAAGGDRGKATPKQPPAKPVLKTTIKDG